MSDGTIGAFCSYLVDTKGRAESTAVTYGDAVRDFQRRLGIEDLSKVVLADLDRYAAKMSHAQLSENTRRGRLTALRVFFEFTHSRGITPTNPAKGLIVWRARDTRRIDTFTEEEVERLVFGSGAPAPVQGPKEPDRLFDRRARVWLLTEARDHAMVGLVYMQAMRAGEVGKLRRADYAVRAKGSFLTIREAKHSDSPVSRRVDSRVNALVVAYLAELDRQRVRHPALFPPLDPKLCAQSDAGIGPNGFRDVLRRLVSAAGIEVGGRRITPHVVRYSRATHLYARGFPLLKIQALLRHKRTETTRRYIVLGSDAAITGQANRIAPWTRLPLEVAVAWPEALE